LSSTTTSPGASAGAQELLDVGAKRRGRAGDRTIEHQRRDDATRAQPGDKSGDPPVAMGHGRDQALAARAAAVAARHVGGRPGLIEEHEPCRVHEGLPGSPQPTLAGDVGAVLLGRPQGLFLRLRPIRRSALWIVERPATMPQRRCSSPWSSASVMSGCASTSLLRSASCGASSGRRCPPKRAGAGAASRAHSLQELDPSRGADGASARRRTDRAAPLDRAHDAQAQIHGDGRRHGDIFGLSQPILSNHRCRFHAIGKCSSTQQ
jgi:hypothetical protein